MTPSSQQASDYRIETGETKEGVVALLNIKDDIDSNSRQVVPFTEGGLNSRNKSIGRTRALQEIEKIKQIKRDRESKKEAELDKLRKASA